MPQYAAYQGRAHKRALHEIDAGAQLEVDAPRSLRSRTVASTDASARTLARKAPATQQGSAREQQHTRSQLRAQVQRQPQRRRAQAQSSAAVDEADLSAELDERIEALSAPTDIAGLPPRMQVEHALAVLQKRSKTTKDEKAALREVEVFMETAYGLVQTLSDQNDELQRGKTLFDKKVR